MAKTNLQIIVDAKDNASGVLGRIGGALGSLGTIAAGAALAGVVALGAGIAWAVGQAMEAEDGLAELNAAIASTGGAAGVTAESAQLMALGLQDLTRFSDDAILKGQSMLLTFTKIGKDVFPDATVAMLNMTQKFGSMDAAAVQLGKALNDPVEGVTALRRVGVMLTDAQEETIQRMVDMGDIAGAQRVILAELETEFGGLAVAMGQTLAGRLIVIKNRFGEVGEAIGAQFIPVLTLVVDKIFDFQDSAMGKALFAGMVSTALDAANSIEQIVLAITDLSSGDVTGAMARTTALLMKLGLSKEQSFAIVDTVRTTINSIADLVSGNKIAAAGAAEDLLIAIGLTPAQSIAIVSTVENTIDAVTNAVDAFMRGGLFGGTTETPGGTLHSGGLLRALGLSDTDIKSVEASIDKITIAGGKIGEAFGKIFAAGTGAGVEEGNALVQLLETLAVVMEKIAAAGDVAAQIRAIVDATGGIGAGANAIIEGGTGIDLARAGEMRPVAGQFGGSFDSAQAAAMPPAPGQFGGSFDFGPFITAIANAITGAPPPVVNVSANLDGAQIANSVSVRLGSESQGLNRMGGHAPLR